MGIEIERKFLLKNDSWQQENHVAKNYRQGYLHRDSNKTIRVRIGGDKGFITIKGKSTGLAQQEFEYEIPVDDAEELIGLCSGLIISKTRHVIPAGKHRWEIDVFHAENTGLVLAEIELSDEHEEFIRPSWLGEEVTADKRYSNAALSINPYSDWK